MTTHLPAQTAPARRGAIQDLANAGPEHIAPTIQAFSLGEVLLRLPQVLAKTGRCRSSVLEDVKGGRFPRPVKMGRSTAWPASEVEAWVQARIRESRGG